MTPPRIPSVPWWTMAIAACCCVGCDDGNNLLIEQTRSRLLLDQQPASVSSIASIQHDVPADAPVTVAGRIFASGLSPFDPEQASFSLIELPKPGHDHENPGDCPFCKRELENAATAIVQITDEQGGIIPVPADRLLGLARNHDITVTGMASHVGDLLILSATKVHVLSEDAAQKLAAEIHAEADPAGDSATNDGSPEDHSAEEKTPENSSEHP